MPVSDCEEGAVACTSTPLLAGGPSAAAELRASASFTSQSTSLPPEVMRRWAIA
jgi:hypothetical protein